MARIGFGKDIHVFKRNVPLVLGGVTIPSKKGLVSHADGDCVIHSIVDSILGAIGERDIGTLFSDKDPKYEGISSTYFLEEMKKLLKEKGYKISNIDVFISLEEPKIAPFITNMKEVISEKLGIATSQISIKAGTNEKMGYIGKRKACESYAVCLVEEENGKS